MGITSSYVHPQLQHLVAKMTLFDTFLFYVIHFVDKFGAWHRLPVLIGLFYMGIRRHLHQRYNLMEVGSGSKSGSATGRTYDTKEFCYRTADGKCNHPNNHVIGSRGTFFGRNMLPFSSNYGLMDPHPSVVATKLLARKKFIDTGEQFNMIATSWIQFMIHDWIDHLEDTQQVNQFILPLNLTLYSTSQAPIYDKTNQGSEICAELRAPHEIASACPLKSFKFFKTKRISTGEPDMKDGSVIYGNNEEGMRGVRAFKEGKLRIGGDGLLEHDEKWIPISGDVRNCWAGFSLLQALFVREHNAVCDTLKEHYPDLDDEKLYRYARLVTSAVIAKIHTIDWTVELLKTDTLLAGMRVNWYGLLGKRFKDLFGHICGPVLSGLVGLRKPNDHGVPYSLTEEFSSVYKMHSLLPDKVILRDITNSTNPNYECPPVSQE
ncbi:Peroxidase [Gossypium australe]|uniref:Peroxidase n=1 Tax=Gossypium australe TaxID=47621 RepID=A0A5B6UAK6_9ROSI|nr:Peroxidase [Gossypium australe]